MAHEQATLGIRSRDVATPVTKCTDHGDGPWVKDLFSILGFIHIFDEALRRLRLELTAGLEVQDGQNRAPQWPGRV